MPSDLFPEKTPCASIIVRDPSHKQPRGAIIKAFHRNSQLRYFHSKLRHPQRHKLAREPANLRGSCEEFQELGDRLATSIESSLKIFQVLTIS